MGELLVRWATRWDRKSLVAMVQALAAEHGREVSEETLGSALEYALSHPSEVRYAVAQRDEQLVGTACLQAAYSTWAAAPYGSIEDVYVLPAARGSGVGTALLELLVAEARKRGYCRVELHVQEDNDEAWHFYEARGFRFTGQLVYEMSLGED